MKHIEDIQLKDIEISIYETPSGFVVDIKNEKGELIEGRKLDKQILVDHLKNPKKALYMQRKGCVRTKVTNDELLK